MNYSRKVIDEQAGEEILEVSLAGRSLLDDPLLNKGMAFTDEERREFGLLGLLPPRVSTVEEQLERNYENYRRKESDIERYIFLMALQDRNETLFYKLLGRHISEMTPIIYTPVVGAASQLYSHIYRRPRGLYISYRHRGEIKTLLSNAPHPDVAIIVVTDGERLSDQRIVMFGAGSAATGIADQIVAALISEGCSEQGAKQRLWLIDVGGLIHTGRGDIEEISRPFAQPVERIADWQVADRNHITLADVVKHSQPTALIGTAAQPGAFMQDIVEEMARHVARPIIFPLSNPTSRSEAKPVDLLAWTSGRAIIATGSPFADAPQSVTGGGRPRKIGQCNNAYIFPGVGLGVIASGARRVRQEMFVSAARALSEMSPALNDRMASLFPDLNAIREVSRRVAIAVGIEAQALGLAEATTREELEERVDEKMWAPRYLRYRRSAK